MSSKALKPSKPNLHKSQEHVSCFSTEKNDEDGTID